MPTIIPPPRGRTLERAIKKLFESYASRGIHCQQNFPEILNSGIHIHKHGFDFQIFYKGKFIAFDAKECALNAWPLDKAKLHQLKALIDVESNGGEGFFLVYFTAQNPPKLIKFTARAVQSALSSEHKSLPPDRGIPTKINLLEI